MDKYNISRIEIYPDPKGIVFDYHVNPPFPAGHWRRLVRIDYASLIDSSMDSLDKIFSQAHGAALEMIEEDYAENEKEKEKEDTAQADLSE